MTRKTADDFQEETSPQTRGDDGKIRRMPISLTQGVLWQITGHQMLDGTDETHDAPVFSGIGFASRPPDNGSPEAIVAFVGGPSNPVIIATRDEATRATAFAASGELQAGETAIFNAGAIVLIKADGTIEIRSVGGAAVALATKADVDKIGTAIAGATVIANDGGASLQATILAGLGTSLHGAAGTTPWPVGTTKLKAE